jgi:uncharacterized membrane protein
MGLNSFLGLKIKLIKVVMPNFIHAFFFILFSLVSILNHYYFRSAGLDYGLANQALYQFAHFKSAIISETLNAESLSYLSCHLSFWVPILSPFYWLFGSYTLLIFQNLALIFAGIGLTKLTTYFNLRKGISNLVLIQFYCFFAIYAALAFDYHDNVIGACFLPWLFYFYLTEKTGLTLLCFFAVLISKENMAILLGFTSITMWLLNKGFTWKNCQLPIMLLLGSLSWFLIASMIIMPAISPNGNFEQLSRYSYMGSSLKEIVNFIFTHPLKMIELFYKSHIQPDNQEIVKQEFLWVLFLSGGFALIRKPAFLWMALPIFMQKLWNKELAFWGLDFHYQIELAAIVSMAIIFWIKDIKSFNLQVCLIVLTTMSTAFITCYKMDNRYSDYHHPEKENIFMKAHYQAPTGFQNIQKGIQLILKDSPVCTQTNLMPHFSDRDRIYHFPMIRDARYLVFLHPQLNSYPLSNELAMHFIDSIRLQKNWKEDSTYSPLRIITKLN